MKQRENTENFDQEQRCFFRKTSAHSWGYSSYHCGTIGPGSGQTISEELDGSTGNDGRMRPCTHTLHGISYTTDDLEIENPSSTTFQWKVPGAARRAFMLSRAPIGNLVTMSDSDRRALDAEALENMLPSMANGFSILNFIYEMKDFRNVAEAFLKRKGRLRALLFGDSPHSRTKLKREFRDKPLSKLSQTYLNYSFAWKPLVSDLMQIYENLFTVDDRLKEIWARAGRPQTRHYSRELDNYPIPDEGVWVGNSKYAPQPISDISSPYWPNWLRYQTNTRYLEAPSYHATVRYTYEVPGVLDERAKIKGWLDAFGARPDPSIIWNAIPFTFLIDYVVDVGGYLRRFSSDNLGLQTTIEDFCSSLKSVVIRDYGFTHEHGSYPYGSHSLAGSVLSKSYERKTSIPDVHSAITTTGLSAREISIGAALVGANGTRRPRS